MSTVDNLRTAAADRHRNRLFGAASFDIYDKSPSGETIIGMFTSGWCGQRVAATTDAGGKQSGSWQFQLKALPDWETSQIPLLKSAVLKIGNRRWTVKKVEKPIGLSLMWKFNAEIQ
jgi:hypothetical protein